MKQCIFQSTLCNIIVAICRKKSPSDLDDGSNQISNQSAVENSYVNPVIGESEEDADTLSTYM